jgi:hypothetical protein
MFVEMQRFFEEIIRKAPFSGLKSLILSKGNKVRFKKELAQTQPTVLFIKEQCQLADIVFLIERARRQADALTSIVFRGKLAPTKDFALFLNEFLKECTNLESLHFINTNVGDLL